MVSLAMDGAQEACGLQQLAHSLSRCDTQAYLFLGMGVLPGPGIEPLSSALAGGFLTTEPPGSPLSYSSTFLFHCLEISGKQTNLHFNQCAVHFKELATQIHLPSDWQLGGSSHSVTKLRSQSRQETVLSLALQPVLLSYYICLQGLFLPLLIPVLSLIIYIRILDDFLYSTLISKLFKLNGISDDKINIFSFSNENHKAHSNITL